MNINDTTEEQIMLEEIRQREEREREEQEQEISVNSQAEERSEGIRQESDRLALEIEQDHQLKQKMTAQKNQEDEVQKASALKEAEKARQFSEAEAQRQSKEKELTAWEKIQQRKAETEKQAQSNQRKI